MRGTISSFRLVSWSFRYRINLNTKLFKFFKRKISFAILSSACISKVVNSKCTPFLQTGRKKSFGGRISKPYSASAVWWVQFHYSDLSNLSKQYYLPSSEIVLHLLSGAVLLEDLILIGSSFLHSMVFISIMTMEIAFNQRVKPST